MIIIVMFTLIAKVNMIIIQTIFFFNTALVTWRFETCGNLLVPLFVLCLHLLVLLYDKDTSLGFSSAQVTNAGLRHTSLKLKFISQEFFVTKHSTPYIVVKLQIELNEISFDAI